MRKVACCLYLLFLFLVGWFGCSYVRHQYVELQTIDFPEWHYRDGVGCQVTPIRLGACTVQVDVWRAPETIYDGVRELTYWVSPGWAGDGGYPLTQYFIVVSGEIVVVTRPYESHN